MAKKKSANEKLLERFQEQLSFLPREEKLLFGISGGADSVALLYLLLELGYKNLTLCHFDHQLRGEASDGDAAFVQELAQFLNLPCEIGHEDIAARAIRDGMSCETAARAGRYEFFATIAKKEECRMLLLAHHGDDQLETIFFNFLRGTGSAGLAGMLPISERIINEVSLCIIRPLLSFSKRELINYLNEKKIAFRHDASNDSLEPTRNRLRHRLLPLLDEIVGTSYRDAINRTASILEAENDFLESLATPLATEEQLTTGSLKALPLALQRRVIHAWLRNHDFTDVGFAEVERVRSLLSHDSSAKVNLPNARHVRRRAGIIFLE